MVALRASRLVWLGDAVDQRDHLADLLRAVGERLHDAVGALGALTASNEICDDWVTCRAISRIEIDISSVAAATVCTLPEVCSAAAATLTDC